MFWSRRKTGWYCPLLFLLSYSQLPTDLFSTNFSNLLFQLLFCVFLTLVSQIYGALCRGSHHACHSYLRVSLQQSVFITQPFSCFVRIPTTYTSLEQHFLLPRYFVKHLTLFSCITIFRANSGIEQTCSLIVYFCSDIYLEDVNFLWASTDAPFVHSTSYSAPNMDTTSLFTDEIKVNTFL